MSMHCPECDTAMGRGARVCPGCGWCMTAGVGDDAEGWTRRLIGFGMVMSALFVGGSLVLLVVAAVQGSAALFWTGLGFLLLGILGLAVQALRLRHLRTIGHHDER